MSHHQTPSRFFALALILSAITFGSSVWSAIKFSSQQSRMRFNSIGSRFYIDAPIANFNGTLEFADISANRFQGVSNAITFADGCLDGAVSSMFFTGVFDPINTDVVKLTGSLSAPNRLRADPGALLPGIIAVGNYNSIEGVPFFTGAITLTDLNTSVTLAISNKLNANITFNNGTIILENSLELADSVIFSGAGNIDFSARGLSLPGRDTTWTSTLCMINAAALELSAPFKLSGTWWFASAGFGFSQVMSRSVINGNGMVLDMSTCGTIVVRAGHTLEINNCVIKGLGSQEGEGGGSVDGLGFFLMEDQYSTVSFNGCTLMLGANYTLTQGTFCFYGAASTVVSGNYTFSATNNLAGASIKVDSTSLMYNTLTSLDKNNVIQPDGVSVVSVNNGVVSNVSSVGALYVDTPFYQQLRNESITSINRVLNFRGTSASNMTWNGGGCSLTFARGSGQAGSLVVAAGKTVTFENVVLKDFSSACCSLGAGAALVFGNGVTLELGAYEDLSMTWSFTGQTTPSIIRGAGNSLNLGSLSSNFVGLAVGAPSDVATSAVTLWLNDLKVLGVQGAVVSVADTYRSTDAYIASRNLIRCINNYDIISLRNSEINLSGNYTFSTGSINIYNDVALKGKGYTFAFSSNGTLAINSASTLLIDRNVTFSYDSSGIGALNDFSYVLTSNTCKDQLTMADQTSRLFLNGCTFYGTTTSPRLQTGVVVVADYVTMVSEGTVEANSISFSNTSGLLVEALSGSVLDVFGALSYSS